MRAGLMKNKLLKYSKVLGGRVYRPVKPVVSPLLKRIKTWQLLLGLVGIGVIGIFLNGWQVRGNVKVSWWPWSSKAHSQMAVMWLKIGNEEKAVEELKIANKLMVIKIKASEEELKKAEEAVNEPEKIRQEIKSWEKIVEEKPSYRDVWLRLAVLNYQLKNDDNAREALEVAMYLDPNDAQVQEIKEIIF